mmetsp:Transcript_15047/g.43487  ORF Transcript_15047/g.43487 Transcript_15047/m.43487 type:complete len:399 (-) Transcript_15047:4159-5355(-)
METSTSPSSASLASSLERMEMEDEPPFTDDDDDGNDLAAEYGERHQLFGGGAEKDGMLDDNLDLVQSEWCCSRYLPRSHLGRLLVFLSIACNVYYFVGTSQTRRNAENKGTAPCAVVLNTFPNSGTTWTQAVFSASTGIASLAVYPEGPPSPFSTHTFVHGKVGDDSRLPDPAHGECLFVKSHRRVTYGELADGSPDQLYQRAVVLYRDPEDNLHANLRYLTKLHNVAKRELLELCSYDDPDGRPLPDDTPFEDWANWNVTDYASFVDLHRMSHQRFYCHAERYPVPKMIVTYARLLSEPYETFRDIMTFSGYADADIDRALEENPPRSHEVHGSLDYVPVDLGIDVDVDVVGEDGNGVAGEDITVVDPCAGLTRQFQHLWKKASPCAKRAAKILQFT